jgi:hypothetical protein
VIKYDLTDADFIWDVLSIAWEFKDKDELCKKLKKPSFNIVLPFNNVYFGERYEEIKKKGLDISRKERQQKREIRKEMEDAYIKEGDDVYIKGELVNAKAVYSRNKTNKEVTEYTPSFRKIISDDMNPIILNIYTDAMEEIVKEYKEKRKKEAVMKKSEKEREKQIKLMKDNPDEKSIEKVEVRKPTTSIVKNVIKPIK